MFPLQWVQNHTLRESRVFSTLWARWTSRTRRGCRSGVEREGEGRGGTLQGPAVQVWTINLSLHDSPSEPGPVSLFFNSGSICSTLHRFCNTSKKLKRILQRITRQSFYPLLCTDLQLCRVAHCYQLNPFFSFGVDLAVIAKGFSPCTQWIKMLYESSAAHCDVFPMIRHRCVKNNKSWRTFLVDSSWEEQQLCVLSVWGREGWWYGMRCLWTSCV